MRQNRQAGLQCHNVQKMAGKTRLTFRELVSRKEENLVKVNCYKGMNVQIGKVGRGMFADRGRKVAKKERVVVGGRGTMSLKACLEAFATSEGKQYLFSAVEYSRPHSHRGKSLSILSQLVSQTKQKQHISTQKKQPLMERLISRNREEKPLNSYLSQRNIKQEQKRPALKSIENINPNQINSQLKEPVEFKKTEKQFFLNISVPKKLSPHQKENTDSANKPAPVLDHNPDIIRLKSIQVDPLNPRFSFGEMMKLGMISPDSLPNNKTSFKLAGQDELQGKRKESNQMEFQEFSSIISNQLKQTRKDLQLDSIKNDIEKIQSCLENMPQPLKEKKPAPFRFRKKQEVVQHLVTARIVSKESSSINIP